MLTLVSLLKKVVRFIASVFCLLVVCIGLIMLAGWDAPTGYVPLGIEMLIRLGGLVVFVLGCIAIYEFRLMTWLIDWKDVEDEEVTCGGSARVGSCIPPDCLPRWPKYYE